MMAKAPAFQFYPGDWLNDIKLQSCSLQARGLLIDLMCLMHQSSKYGYLLINGLIPPKKTVSHLLRLHHKTYDKTLKELFLYGVLKEDGNGVIYCERMIKDEYIREVRRESGKLGGSPLLKQTVKQTVKQSIKQTAKQKQTPSSSSSSSSIDLSKDKSNKSKNQPEIDFEKPTKKQKEMPSAAKADSFKNDSKKSHNHFSEKVGSFFESIKKSCEIISRLPQKNGRKFNPYQWVQKHINEKRHPGAVDDVLKAMSVAKYWNGIRGDPYAYANSILKTKNQNWNEKESIAIHNELKNMDVSILAELTNGLFKEL